MLTHFVSRSEKSSGLVFENKQKVEASRGLCRELGVDSHRERVGDVAQGAQLTSLVLRNATMVSLARELFSEVRARLTHPWFVLLLSDAQARIIECFSSAPIADYSQRIGLVAGASLSDESCGNNAVNLALRYREPAFVVAQEHYCRVFHAWCMAAAPVVYGSGELGGALCFAVVNDSSLGEKLALTSMMSDRLCGLLQRTLASCTGERQGADGMTVPVWAGRRQETLSPRKCRIVALLTQGKSCKQIAAQLQISARTVESHLEQLRDRFQAKTTIELIAILFDCRLSV